jgi:OCT family organic cation transporter-like MFS transporter 18
MSSIKQRRRSVGRMGSSDGGSSEGEARVAKGAPSAAVTSSYSTLLIYFTVSLYAVAFMSQQPTKVYWVRAVTEGSADAAATYASFTSFLALLQLLGSLFAGALVDRVGPKAVLLLSLVASVLVYGLTAHASTISTLFLAGIPSVLQHAFLASRSYLTSTLPSEQHAIVIGRMGVAYGIGMLIGPYAGGLVAAHSLATAAVAAALLSAATAAMVLVLLPEVRVGGGGGSSGSSGAAGAAGAVAAAAGAAPTPHSKPSFTYGALLAIPGIAPALALKGLFFLSSNLFQTIVTLLAVERFKLDPSGMGTVLSIVGASSAAANLLAPPLLAGVPLRTTLCSSALALAASIFALGLLPPSASLGLFLLCVPQTAMGAVFSTLQSTQMTTITPPALQGSLAAADMALRSGLAIFSPFLAQGLLQHAGHFASTTVPAAIMVGVALLAAAV